MSNLGLLEAGSRHDLRVGVSPDAPDDAIEQHLIHAMAQLNPQSVEILILRYEHNYSDAEIAKMLGKSRGTVAVTLYRARARLRKLLRSMTGERL